MCDKGKMCSPTILIEAIRIQHLVLSPLRHNSKATVSNPYCKNCVPLTAGGNMELYRVRKSPPSLAGDKEVAFLFNRGVILHLVGTRQIVLKYWKENMKTMRKREASVEMLVFLFHHVGRVSNEIYVLSRWDPSVALHVSFGKVRWIYPDISTWLFKFKRKSSSPCLVPIHPGQGYPKLISGSSWTWLIFWWMFCLFSKRLLLTRPLTIISLLLGYIQALAPAIWQLKKLFRDVKQLHRVQLLSEMSAVAQQCHFQGQQPQQCSPGACN